MQYQVSRVALGKNGLRFDVIDSERNNRVVKSFRAHAPLDPAANKKAEEQAIEFCRQKNSTQAIAQLSLFEIDSRDHGAVKVYNVEVTYRDEFFSVNVAVNHGKVVDYSGIPGDLPRVVKYFLAGHGFDVSEYGV